MFRDILNGSEEHAKPVLDELPVKKREKLEQLKLPA
jgi:hypothetical protein